MSTVRANADEGKAFETVFENQARACGLYSEKNHLTCRRTYGGHVQVISADLDFKLINQQGRVGYFDAKCFERDFFVFSQLKEDQINRAVHYNDMRVSAGFVVWFKGLDRVCFYSGHTIAAKGPRSNFTVEDGILLGGLANFSLDALLAIPNAAPLLRAQ